MIQPLIYLAGPITKPDPNVNCRDAILIADDIMAGYPVALFTPQLSVLHQMISPRTHEEWLEYDFGVIQNCAAILRIQGTSIGADMEELYAYKMGIPVFQLTDEGWPQDDFDDWLEDWYFDGDNLSDVLELEARKAAIAYGRDARLAHADYGYVKES